LNSSVAQETRYAIDPLKAEFDHSHALRLVRDLNRVNRTIYWTDLLLSAAVGWLAFGLAVAARPFSVTMFAAAAVSICCLYRGLCFIHEISHQTARTLPGFETAYNLAVGFPFLMPSFLYTGVHPSHHNVSIYGTDQDPEYLPFARSWMMTTGFAIQSFLIPALLIFRFVVLTPLGLLSPRFQRWLVVHASSFTMNVKYRREAKPEMVRKVRNQSAFIFVLWAAFLGSMLSGFVSWRALVLWVVVCGIAAFINALRALGAHAYESSGEPMDRMGQLQDSIDTPGAFWTELWAPVGLRYHALHHYFPGIPYHNLPEAYRRLVGCLPISDEYKKMSSPSLPHSVRELIRKGLAAIQ
jgi:fatty acid desaturase